MIPRAAYILTGGKSSRFGEDKALFEIDGRPMALAVAAQLRGVVAEVRLVGRPEKYSHLGLTTIHDRIESAGPLAGIAAALEDSPAKHTLVVACDMPNLRPQLVELLFEIAVESGAQATVPMGLDSRPQPLCCVYSRLAAAPLTAALDNGVRKITDALERLTTRYVRAPEYDDIDATGESFRNINSPADLPASPERQ